MIRRWASSSLGRRLLGAAVVVALLGASPRGRLLAQGAGRPTPDVPSARGPNRPPGRGTKAEARRRLLIEASELRKRFDDELFAGRFRSALERNEQLVAVIEKLYPPGAPAEGRSVLARYLKLQGMIHLGMGARDLAAKPFRRALEIEEALGPGAPEPEDGDDLPILSSRRLLTKALAGIYLDRGDYGEALAVYRLALRRYERLYPHARYPRGSLDLAETLNSLGFVLQAMGDPEQALTSSLRAVRMLEDLALEPHASRGNTPLVASLINLGRVYVDLSEFDKARRVFEQALRTAERLHAGDHPETAQCLNELGHLNWRMGRNTEAVGLLRRALGMYDRVTQTNGASGPVVEPLAATLTNLGIALEDLADPGQALPYHNRALGVLERAFPPQQYPRGHEKLVAVLNNLGFLYMSLGDAGKSLRYYRRALEMGERLYPREEYPAGHRQVLTPVLGAALAFHKGGDDEQARACFHRALAMGQALYPPSAYPDGHVIVLTSHLQLGFVLLNQREFEQSIAEFTRTIEGAERLRAKGRLDDSSLLLPRAQAGLGAALYAAGRPGDALGPLSRASELRRQTRSAVLESASEVEALSYLTASRNELNMLISARVRSARKTDDLFDLVWPEQGAVAEMVRLRHRALVAAGDAETRSLGRELAAVRHGLATLLLAPDDRAGKKPERLRSLNARKEEVERQLAARLPELVRASGMGRPRLADFTGKFPPTAVLLDILQYYESPAGQEIRGAYLEGGVSKYLAFVVSRGRAPVTVALGPARPIDDTVKAWRDEIAAGRAGPSAAELRRLVWDKAERQFPDGTTTVYIVPDGALTGVPWAALPGTAPGTVLLERYEVAVAPNGPFLLDRLTSAARPVAGPDRVLAVGGVDYDTGTRVDVPTDVSRAAVPEGARAVWPQLPGTRSELEALRSCSGGRPIVALTGADATIGRVVDELPRVRWAILATHGFFAEPKFRSALQLDESCFQSGVEGLGRSLATPGARNPLTLSGLVLAGANAQRPEDAYGLPLGDGGILTAEAIAGLDLSRLELVVLSACDTGLGEVAGGEGVFGLQRAFHTAGAHDVIASLWKVDDQATAALMKLFYHNFWVKGQTPIAALRGAQLALYRHPEHVVALAATRGPDFSKQVKIVEEAAPGPKSAGRAPVKLWAGFVLSGLGRQPAEPKGRR